MADYATGALIDTGRLAAEPALLCHLRGASSSFDGSSEGSARYADTPRLAREEEMPASPIEFWFDFSSGYAYFAADGIDALGERHGRSVVWRPRLSDERSMMSS